jgi:hypothetical protein
LRPYIVILLLVLMVFLLTSCNIKKFTMPTWDVNLNIPLLNEKFFVSDLIDSVNFFPGDNNSILFQTSGTLDTEPIGAISIPMDVDTGELPLQSGIILSDTFPLSNFQTGREVAYGLISEGELRVTFSDMSPLVQSVTLTLDIMDSNGDSLSIEYPGTEGGYVIPLAGCSVGTEDSNTIIEHVDFTVSIIANVAPLTPVGSLRLGVIDDLVFTKFRGRIPSFTIDVVDNQSHIDIEYPWGIENAIQLQEANIVLHVENPIAYPCIINGDFYAVNYTTGQADTISLVDENGLPYSINPRVGDVPGITDITFSGNVDQLLRIMPEYIELRNANFQIENSSGEIGELNATDVISGDYIANSPFSFVLLPALITPRDTMKIEISQENSDTIRKNILSATMRVGILNQLPIGAETKMYFGTSSSISPDDSTTWAFQPKAAHIYAKTEPNAEQIIQMNLTHDELMVFTNPVVYMKQTFLFDASDGAVTIMASPADYIQLQIMINVETHVEE